MNETTMNGTGVTIASSSERNGDGRFLSGNPGGPGRRLGSRHKLAENFISSIQDDFRRHGPGVIEQVRREDPSCYLRVVGALMPRELAVEITFDPISRCESIPELIEVMIATADDDPHEMLARLKEFAELIEARLANKAVAVSG